MHARVLARMICTQRVVVQHVRELQVAMLDSRFVCTSKQLPDFGSSIPLLHVALLSRDGRCVSVLWFCDAAGEAAPVFCESLPCLRVVVGSLGPRESGYQVACLPHHHLARICRHSDLDRLPRFGNGDEGRARRHDPRFLRQPSPDWRRWRPATCPGRI